MNEHPIEGLMTTAMENLKDMVDVNTIIGDPIESPDGSVIITVSKVGFGFAAGGSDFYSQQSLGSSDSSSSEGQPLPFGGGSGGGVSITPIAFLIVNGNGVQMIHLDQHTHLYERMLDLAPQAAEKIQEILKGSQKGDEKGESKGKDGKKEDKKEKKESEEKPSNGDASI
ncbi:GerW family sporulation protein [Radiobacillus kanasensis]|uniref:GerW family sporulation protein n=1 Tax=Radiobacillus kanasensis TaxID=2844358 RepID=UPI001E5BAF92|nr:GerW family sporulation protein [Radiobacillus kanasensis]UFT98033.1 GerW family sporulation protein [Radiobacillus kanasensis]